MIKKLFLTSALLAIFASAYAQSSQNFGVTGTILPAPCNVTLTGGVIDLGALSKTTAAGNGTIFATNTFYIQPRVNVPINIVCPSATNVNISLIDNKPGKNLLFGTYDIFRFGITDGAAGTTAIGAYTIYFADANIDGISVGAYVSKKTGTLAWTTKLAGTLQGSANIIPDYTTGFAKSSNATTPEAFTRLSGNLAFDTYLGKSYTDSATSIVLPTGSGTLTLTYL